MSTIPAVRLGLMASALGVSLLLSSCVDDGPPPGLSGTALEGRSLSVESGCSACHGKNGEGGVGPPWQDLADSRVTFDDGTTRIADTAYLTDSIKNPSARVRDGYSLRMPQNSLVDAEIEKVVAYIQELR